MAGSDWFTQEADKDTLAKEKKAQSQAFQRKNQKRLWLPVGSNKEIVVVDDVPRCIHEHGLLINGERKGNWFTCIKKLDVRSNPQLEPYWGGCPLCAIDEAYFIGFVTVIVTTPFRLSSGPDRGKEIVNYRMLWPLKLNGIEWFNEEKRRRKSLIGARYELQRKKKSGEPSYGTPSFLDKVNLDAPEFEVTTKDGNVLKPEPFDYGAIIAPLPRSELLTLAASIRAEKEGRGSGGGGCGGQRRPQQQQQQQDDGDDGGPDFNDDDIPF